MYLVVVILDFKFVVYTKKLQVIKISLLCLRLEEGWAPTFFVVPPHQRVLRVILSRLCTLYLD